MAGTYYQLSKPEYQRDFLPLQQFMPSHIICDGRTTCQVYNEGLVVVPGTTSFVGEIPEDLQWNTIFKDLFQLVSGMNWLDAFGKHTSSSEQPSYIFGSLPLLLPA